MSTCKAKDDGVRCTRSSKGNGCANGFCAMHYRRYKRNGFTDLTVPHLGPVVQVAVKLPDEMHGQVVDLAGERGSTVSDVVRDAVADYLKKP